MVLGTIVHSCVSVSRVLCLAGILILGRSRKMPGGGAGFSAQCPVRDGQIRCCTELLMVSVQVSICNLVEFIFLFLSDFLFFPAWWEMGRSSFY